jgi:hypothetical protein
MSFIHLSFAFVLLRFEANLTMMTIDDDDDSSFLPSTYRIIGSPLHQLDTRICTINTGIDNRYKLPLYESLQ